MRILLIPTMILLMGIVDILPGWENYWLIVVLALLGMGLSSWVLIPPPTMTVLPLAVVAPEISPLLWVGNGAIALLAIMGLWNHPGWMGVSLGCSGVGLLLGSIPLLHVPAVLKQLESQFQATFGDDYAAEMDRAIASTPSAQSKLGQMRSRPFVAADLLRGIALPSGNDKTVVSMPTPDGAMLKGVIYRADRAELSETRSPTIVTVYGGAWRVGQPEDTADFSRYLTAQGYGVVAIAYRHAPTHQFPTQLEDVQTALAWIAAHGEQYGLDSQRVALVGWSAGAHLAMLAAYQGDGLPYESPSPTCTIKAVVNYYGPVNLVEGYRDRPVPDPIDVRSVLTTFLGGTPQERPDVYQAASPINYVRPGLPPTLLIYGDRDHLVSPTFGHQLHAKLQSANNCSMLLRLPWAEHAFDRVFRGMGNQITLYYVERFLAATLGGDSG